MPFKGDMRLGGPHDNEAKLNGSSEGPSVPTAGTLIRTDTNVLRFAEDGGSTVYYNSPISVQTYYIPNRTWTVPVKADGLGGWYYDWQSATNPVYLTGGILPDTSQSSDTYVSVYGTQHLNGTNTSYYSHNGSGGYSIINSPSYYEANTTTPFHVEVGLPYFQEFEGSSYQVGTKTVYFYHDGSGGFTSADYGSPNYYANDTVVGTRNVTTTMFVTPLDGTFTSGTFIYELVINSQNIALRNYPAHGTFISAGTRITPNQPYYHDGNGGWYYDNIGISTGNSSSGTNYITVPTYYGMSESVPNGTYTTNEYYAGIASGGTYFETTYEYAPNGATLHSFGYSDSYYNYYVTHKSNGQGGYYTESTQDYIGGNQGGGTSYPSAGTTTGNSNGGTNYITINGNSYENGSFSSTEYHDGSGGTYWSTSTYYQYSGWIFFTDSWSDEYGTYYTNYVSDGNGSYYTTS